MMTTVFRLMVKLKVGFSDDTEQRFFGLRLASLKADGHDADALRAATLVKQS